MKLKALFLLTLPFLTVSALAEQEPEQRLLSEKEMGAMFSKDLQHPFVKDLDLTDLSLLKVCELVDVLVPVTHETRNYPLPDEKIINGTPHFVVSGKSTLDAFEHVLYNYYKSTSHTADQERMKDVVVLFAKYIKNKKDKFIESIVGDELIYIPYNFLDQLEVKLLVNKEEFKTHKSSYNAKYRAQNYEMDDSFSVSILQTPKEPDLNRVHLASAFTTSLGPGAWQSKCFLNFYYK